MPRAFATNPPAAVFVGVQTVVPTTGLSGPTGLATDAVGNLYIADTNNNRVVKVTPAGVQSTVLSGTVAGAALSNPHSLAFDSAGNLYVADSGNNRVLEIAPDNTATTVGSGLSNPMGVAVDTGIILIADTGNNRVVMIASGTQSVLTISGVLALSMPAGIEMSENYYEELFDLADTGNNRVLKCHIFTGQTTAYCSIVPITVTQPTAVMAPSALYVADTGNNRVLSKSSAGIMSIAAGVSSPQGLAADHAGNRYIADTGNNRILKIATTPAVAPSADFGNVPVGHVTTLSLTFAFPWVTTLTTQLNDPTVGTMGVANLDFTNPGTGSCNTSTAYAAETNCTVTVSLNPMYPGEREGTLLFSETDANAITVYLHGIGVGPQIAYDPGVQTTLATALSDPRAMVVDAVGNVYVANFGANRIAKVTPAGVKSTFATVNNPVSLAIDGAGNLYAAGTRSGNPAILQVFPSGSVNPTFYPNPGIAASGDFGVAIDGAGNLYVGYADPGSVFKLNGFHEFYTRQFYGGFMPGALAVDSSNNIYIVDRDDWLVWKVTPSGNWSTVGWGYNRPAGITVDALGNLYVADFGNNQVVKVTPSGVQSTVGTGLDGPTAVAVDGAGNIYIADLGDGRLIRIKRSIPPSFTFADTAVGTTSSDSPQDVAIENIGNANLTYPVPSTGSDPSLSSNFGLGSSTCPILTTSSSPQTLAPGSTCFYAISFSPTVAGPITGTLRLKDNNLNKSGATQSIPLSGAAH
jgi:sugar lactone lactonase YvrE